MLADVSTDLMTEAAVTLSRVRGALKQGEQAKDSDKPQRKNKALRQNTHVETSGRFFTSLRKQMAFAAASSHRVAAAEPLGFFGRLPNKFGTALRFFPPPGAPDTAEEPAPGSLAPGRWRGATSPSASSSGQSAKVAEGLEPPATPPPRSASSSKAAAPRSGSSTSLSARSTRNSRAGPEVPACGWRRGF